MDSINIIIILPFIFINNCLGTRAKLYFFFIGFKCHLRIHWGKIVVLCILYTIKVLYCPRRLKKIGLRSRVFFVLICLFVYCNNVSALKVLKIFFFFFFGNPWCPGQLTRTTTNPRAHWTSCKPSEHVRHRGGDRRTQRESNPGWGRNKSHDWPQQLDPQV